jgi:chromosome segregation ATPase
MSEQTDNLVLRQLKDLRNEVRDFRRDAIERLDRVESRLSTLEQHVGQIITQAGGDRQTVQSLNQRLERVERRLALSDES